MVVQHNLTAMNANRYLGINNNKLSKSLEKLSSGYQINRAGDNAAGLAVSEKMRSQIAGMTQGVKNAQDGISMVQTFEGALTETDSILQRMKTLADQAANGTYQDDVDRDAIQLEFDQLNDELNQIADTDFNGVIVLNGGQMADGTVAVNGKFDYTSGRTITVVANEATDISGEQADTIADQTTYNKEVADAVWDALGVDVSENPTIDVTFTYDGQRWYASSVADGDGNIIKGANPANLQARAVERDNATGKGGFEVVAGKDPYTGEDIIATNAIFDEMKGLKKGDTVTIRFTNTDAATYAPKNAGVAEDSMVEKKGTDEVNIIAGRSGIKFDLSITDSEMTSDIAKALDALQNATFKLVYDDQGKGTLTAPTVTDLTITAEGKVTYKDGTEIGTLTWDVIKSEQPAKAANATAKAEEGATTGSGITIDGNGKLALIEQALKDANIDITQDQTIELTRANDNGTAKWSSADGKISGLEDADLLTKFGITVTSAQNTDKITINWKAATKAGLQADASVDGVSLEFKLNIDAYNVANLSSIKVHAVATPQSGTLASKVAQEGVSKSNAYGNGKAPLTYTDHIILQAGARSKDAVDFTFKYASGGMGNLLANMNCSAREDGLNTENLSLKTAESANYAIDQIDNAINKVSMVRATFGAVQNRLEHKIDNMNVSIENLTSAESQIRDTDMPSEMMNFTKNQILAQAAQSMLAQANQLPQSVLQLLQ